MYNTSGRIAFGASAAWEQRWFRVSTPGWEVGFAKGFEIGQEIGFYSGCHAVWSRCVKEDPECFSERARRGIDAFGKMLRSFPIDDPLDEMILETLNQVRGKFKTVVALLGMHHEYNDATGDQPTMTF